MNHSPTQLEVLAAGQRAAFEGRVGDSLRDHLPGRLSYLDGAATVAMVNAAVDGARRLGLRSFNAIASYVTVRLLLGEGFESDPCHSWAGVVLADQRLGAPDLRMRKVLAEGFAFLCEAAGSELAHDRRALERARERKRELARAGEGPAATLDWVRTVHPERVAAIGDESLAAALAQAWEGAGALGLATPIARATHAVVAFWLGAAYARDSLHPWARAALAESGHLREERLLEGAFAAIARTLDDGSGWQRQAWAATREPLTHLERVIVAREGLVTVRVAPQSSEDLPFNEGVPLSSVLDAPGNHWVAIADSGDVVVEAETHPHEEEVWRKLTWCGGAAVEGAPHRRRLPRERPGRHLVSVMLHEQCAAIELWVVSARAEIESNEAEAYFVATVEPRGVTRFVRTGWGVRAERYSGGKQRASRRGTRPGSDGVIRVPVADTDGARFSLSYHRRSCSNVVGAHHGLEPLPHFGETAPLGTGCSQRVLPFVDAPTLRGSRALRSEPSALEPHPEMGGTLALCGRQQLRDATPFAGRRVSPAGPIPIDATTTEHSPWITLGAYAWLAAAHLAGAENAERARTACGLDAASYAAVAAAFEARFEQSTE